jgi:hypothetical protein
MTVMRATEGNIGQYGDTAKAMAGGRHSNLLRLLADLA